MKKICNKCGIEQDIENFDNRKNGKRGECKDCRRKYKKEYMCGRRKTAQHLIEYEQEYKKKYNPEYYQKNKEELKLKERERYKKYRQDPIQAEKMRVGGTKRMYKWRKLNPDKNTDASRRRRMLKHNADGSHTTQEFRYLYAEYNCMCLCCKRKFRFKDMTEDHIIPLSKGGSDWINNIQPMCQSCNSSKGVKIIDFRKQ